jgi:manganese transport protein
MLVGWAINSSMIILAAVTFYQNGIKVDELQQAENLLRPLLGGNASIVFAVALLFSGIASSITSAMAGGTISAGFFSEPYNPKDIHTRMGVLVSLCSALVIIFMLGNPFKGLIISQMLLSIQLPITVFSQIYLTSSKKVMGAYKNGLLTRFMLVVTGMILLYFNIRLFISIL